MPWTIALVAVIAVMAFAAGQRASAPAAASPATMASLGGDGAPDLSTMTPRERAARLYDRIMRYAEEGKADSLQFFAPMAMASFEALDSLDVDARYDYGRVATEIGDVTMARAQADTILLAAPSHLLGLALKARSASQSGDTAGARRTWQAFLAAHDAEVARQLPEYQMHANDIAVAARTARATLGG